MKPVSNADKAATPDKSLGQTPNPGSSKAPLIVLDIDKTLLYRSDNALDRACDLQLPTGYIYKRPFADEFLTFCAKHFTVGIWTISGGPFAKAIFGELFKLSFPLAFIWTLEHCVRLYCVNRDQVVSVKDLEKLAQLGYRLDNTIMVDDTVEEFQMQPPNLVNVSPYVGDPKDSELKQLKQYLAALKGVKNIGEIDKRQWQNTLGASKR